PADRTVEAAVHLPVAVPRRQQPVEASEQLLEATVVRRHRRVERLEGLAPRLDELHIRRDEDQLRPGPAACAHDPILGPPCRNARPLRTIARVLRLAAAVLTALAFAAPATAQTRCTSVTAFDLYAIPSGYENGTKDVYLRGLPRGARHVTVRF